MQATEQQLSFNKAVGRVRRGGGGWEGTTQQQVVHNIVQPVLP